MREHKLKQTNPAYHKLLLVKQSLLHKLLVDRQIAYTLYNSSY